jgi:glyoxylase I family protein
MEKVTGIGGFFFRAKDPKALGLWYQQHLGILVIPTSPEESSWQQEAGPTAFTAFKESTDYFGDPKKVWMLNFRVRDLDKMAAQLQAGGIEVKMDPESYPYGRFARCMTLREIRLNCGNLQSQPLHASLLNNQDCF